ncbi:hypothetical protein MMC16_007485 [Acarospora aff. strigata]|nr:hypothetical protein [Acarospora aff. strigata]
MALGTGRPRPPESVFAVLLWIPKTILYSFLRLIIFSYLVDSVPYEIDVLSATLHEVPQFDHQPLQDPRAIRLLKVTLHKQVIDLKIEAFPLNQCPPYCALSYTWGNPECTWPIDRSGEGEEVNDIAETDRWNVRFPVLLDGRKLMVTRNLYDVLSHIRKSKLWHHYFWIDAICINQSDMDERNSQVQIMDEIYEKAFKVVVWLGTEDESTASVLHIITKLASTHREFEQRNEEPGSVFNDHNDYQDVEKLRSLGLQGTTLSDWLNVIVFQGRGWFRRFWVLQEVVLAQEIEVFWGSYWVSFQDLVHGSLFLVRTSFMDALTQIALPWQPNDTWRRVQRPAHMTALQLQLFLQRLPCGSEDYIVAMHRVSDIVKDAVFLDLCLDFASDQEATDPRDKIFGLLGFLKRAAQTHFGMQYPIKVDYRIDTASLYSSVASYIIRETSSLQLLTKVLSRYHKASEVRDLPSWVPDFSLPQINTMSVGMTHLHGDAFSASGSDKPDQIVFAIQDHALHIRAWIAGEVIGTGESGMELNEGKFEKTAKLILGLPKRYKTGQSLIDVLWRTIIHDHTDTQSPAPEALSASFSAHLLTHMVKRVRRVVLGGHASRTDILSSMVNFKALYNQDTNHIIPSLDTILDECERAGISETAYDHDVSRVEDAHRAKLYDDAYKYTHLLGRRTSQNRPFCTSNALLGIGPHVVEPGDMVAIVPSVKTPLLLRRKSEVGLGYCELLGECYVHGIMHGEALSDEGRWQQLVIV